MEKAKDMVSGLWSQRRLGYCSRMSDPSQILIFDRRRLRQNRDRAAAGLAAHCVFFEEIAGQLIERLADIKQEFISVLNLGAQTGFLARHFLERKTPFVVAVDLSEKMLCAAPGLCVAADEEFLPFTPNSFDLIISNLSLHWVNDLPGALVQIKNCLRPGGLFLASLIGGASLVELRTCLMEAELQIAGGASPRLSPTLDMSTASALLQRAGFGLPVTDMENITLEYADLFALMRELRGMGETNVQLNRLRHPTRRQLFTEAARIYRARFGNNQGCLPASFEILFWHGVKH